MSDLISRSELLKAMDKRYKEKKDIVPDNLAEGFMQMENLIKEQPGIYAMTFTQNVAKGEWLYNIGSLDSTRQYKCSKCGKPPILSSNWRFQLTNYCPNCGAKMDGGRE